MEGDESDPAAAVVLVGAHPAREQRGHHRRVDPPVQKSELRPVLARHFATRKPRRLGVDGVDHRASLAVATRCRGRTGVTAGTTRSANQRANETPQE